MESIVSPWFIYLVGLVDGLIAFMAVPIILSAIALIVYFIGLLVNTCDNSLDPENWETAWGKKWLLALVIFSISVFIAVFTPSKNTIIAMYVADKVTYNSIQEAVSTGKDIKETIKKDIIDIIQSVNKQGKDNP